MPQGSTSNRRFKRLYIGEKKEFHLGASNGVKRALQKLDSCTEHVGICDGVKLKITALRLEKGETQMLSLFINC